MHKVALHKPDISKVENIRLMLMRDIIENGLPEEHFPGTVTVSFQQKLWEFDLEVLKMLDLSRFAYDRDQMVHPGRIHTLNLARLGMHVPDIHGELYHAAHRAGTLLVEEFFAAHRRYIEMQNKLLEYIRDMQFDDEFGFFIHWKTIYGEDCLSGEIIRTKL